MHLTCVIGKYFDACDLGVLRCVCCEDAPSLRDESGCNVQEIANGAQAAVETYNAEKKAAIEADEERNGGLNWNAPDAPGPAPTATGGSSSQGSSSDSSQVTPFEDTVVADPVPAPAPTLEPSEPVVVEGDSVPAVVDVPEGTNSDAAFGTNCDPAFPDCETDPVAPVQPQSR